MNSPYALARKLMAEEGATVIQHQTCNSQTPPRYYYHYGTGNGGFQKSEQDAIRDWLVYRTHVSDDPKYAAALSAIRDGEKGEDAACEAKVREFGRMMGKLLPELQHPDMFPFDRAIWVTRELIAARKRIATLTRERDEAQAEVERLQNIIYGSTDPRGDLLAQMRFAATQLNDESGTSPEADAVMQGVAEIERLRAEVERLRAALIRLRDCDWVISLPDRMDAVRDIARQALTPPTAEKAAE